MTPKVRFMNLVIDDPAERAELLANVETIFNHGRFLLGPEVDQLESELAAVFRKAQAVGVASGTDALILGLKALDVGPGDEVITTALSWVATGNAIVATGAEPIFADIGDDLNIDPESVARLISPKTKAIMPVHYAGKLCDMHTLGALARDAGIPLVEDASQAFGARRGDIRVGEAGEMVCMSLNPMKVFAALGEAGVVASDDPKIAKRLRALRYNGMVDADTCAEFGHNGRIDTLQAAFLLTRLPKVDVVIARRQAIAKRYAEALEEYLYVPQEAENCRDAWYTVNLRTPRRDALLTHLTELGIEAKIRDRFLMPEQPSYAGNARGEWTHAKSLAGQLICPPAHEKLTDEDVDVVIDAVRAFFVERGDG